MLAQPGVAALEVHEWGDVVKTGLGEREESVRRAARKLVCGWVDRDADLEKVSASVRGPQLLLTTGPVCCALRYRQQPCYRGLSSACCL
jgi:hypothetical protein